MFKLRSVVLACVVIGSATALPLYANPSTQTAPLIVPATPAGQALMRWLSAFNAGEAVQLQTFYTTYKLDLPPDNDLYFRDISGGFTLIRIDQDEPRHIIALIKEKASDSFAQIELELDTSPAPAIIKIQLKKISPPAEFAPARLSDAELVPVVRARLKQQFADDKFSGVLLIAKGRKVVLDESIGLSNRLTHKSIETNTEFRLASMGKMFTAVAILQLLEVGRLSLDDPLGKYITDYPNKDIAKATIRQLLTHSGGTGDIFTPEFDAHRLELKTLDDYITLFGHRAPEFTPGDHAHYSNYGYILLGVIIQRITDQSYYDYVDAHIFHPIGMSHTNFQPEITPDPLRAEGYMRENGQWVSNAETLPWRGTSAGGGYSTAGDLLKFAKALQSGKLLSPDTLAEATKTQPPGGNYGFGFHADDQSPIGNYGHNGGAAGMSTDLRIFPRSGYIIIALSNLDPPSAVQIADYVTERINVK